MPKPEHEPQFEEIFATEEQVHDRIDEMACELVQKFRGQEPLFVNLLRGGSAFSVDLMRAIVRHDPDFHPELDNMTISRFGSQRKGGKPRVVTDLSPATEIEDRTVIMLDEVLDEGHTADFTKRYLELRGAAEVHLVVLLRKVGAQKAFGEPLLCGFDAPNEWLVGMGMDDFSTKKEAHRWLPYIAIAQVVKE